MTDIFTQDIKDLMKLATEDFDKFYKETEKKSKSSGDCSKSASSGYYSTAASSGNYSTAASSGYYSKSASSGDCSKSASSGNYSTAASSGDCSKSASSGSYSTAASSGSYSTAASSGDCSKSASSGDCSKSASSGYYSKSASSGDCSTAASSGDCSKSASSGDYSTAASSGYGSTAASSGSCSKSASSGDYSKSASSGNYSTAASSGVNSACTALGYRAAVKGDMGNLLMCSEYNREGVPLGGKADLVDGKTIKPNCWYIVKNGSWVEVDFTDGIMMRIISVKGNVKQCKDDDGNTVYIITENGVSAHGTTIKQARDDLAFKLMSKDVAQFKGMDKKTTKTPQEWALIYRAITGACSYGTEAFMQQRELKKQYTLTEILKETKGAYGYERFKEVVE